MSCGVSLVSLRRPGEWVELTYPPVNAFLLAQSAASSGPANSTTATATGSAEEATANGSNYDYISRQFYAPQQRCEWSAQVDPQLVLQGYVRSEL